MKPKDVRTAVEVMDTEEGLRSITQDVQYGMLVIYAITGKFSELMEMGVEYVIEDIKARYSYWIHRARLSWVWFLSGMGLLGGLFPAEVGWPLLRTVGWIWLALTLLMIVATQLISIKNNWAYFRNIKKFRRGILRYQIGLRNCILKNQCKAQKKTIMHKPYNAFLLLWVSAFGVPAEFVGNVFLSHVLTFFLALCWPIRPLIKPS